MNRKGDIPVQNLVYVLKAKERTGRKNPMWLLLDALQRQFYARSDASLNDGAWYSIDFERRDERTIHITNAWNLSDNPYLP